jgi:hypothetical protein
MNSRREVLGSGLLFATTLVAGCLDTGSDDTEPSVTDADNSDTDPESNDSETENSISDGGQELLDLYRNIYEQHENGKEHARTALNRYDADELELARNQFELAEDTYSNSKEEYDEAAENLNLREIYDIGLDEQIPLVHYSISATLRNGRDAFRGAKMNINEIMDDIGVDLSRDLLENFRTEFENGEYDLPSIEDLEAELS